MFKFKIDKNFNFFAEKQITQIKVDPDFYNKMSLSEYSAIAKHLNNPKNILELGCGLGRMSIFLNAHLKKPAHFILADVSETSSKIKYGWNPKESYYNDLELTAKFSELHGLKNFETFNLLERDVSELKNIDLVMSFLSVGFHYPIDQYFKKLLKVTSDDAVMIFGIRRGAVDVSKYKRFFHEVYIEKNSVPSKEDLLILKRKK